MDFPVRLGWLPGEAVVLPGQFPAATDGRSNELLIGPALHGTGSGLRVRCSARTAEVSAACIGDAIAVYDCTLRGIASASEKDIFVIEYLPQRGIRAGSTIRFKLLSLINKSTIRIEAIELLEQPTQDCNTTNNENADSTNHQISSTFSTSGSSQMDGIRDLLAELTVQPTDEAAGTATPDPKRALMAAIAKSALNTRRNQIGISSGGDGSGNTSLNSNLIKSNEGVDAALALLPQMFTLLQQQQQEIRELKISFNKIEALCLETQNLITARHAHSSTIKGEAPA
ncbi:hypothetical protein Ndes2437B_g01156 [Nannochloris sp. 'desiccata']|nr:hypothetical protein KSW81_006260 [Chlorella desiccata (nom. nud.)]